jgi:hypothetical protein
VEYTRAVERPRLVFEVTIEDAEEYEWYVASIAGLGV